ncbi:uncharacterized protein LOC143774154 [Ranitomeya variabilis]|uniref:uncharacterized protein LOC143774154 n=1 Tax=Ranitomeya variabilis TaxID=490064 RepID=UPI004055AB9A
MPHSPATAEPVGAHSEAIKPKGAPKQRKEQRRAATEKTYRGQVQGFRNTATTLKTVPPGYSRAESPLYTLSAPTSEDDAGGCHSDRLGPASGTRSDHDHSHSASPKQLELRPVRLLRGHGDMLFCFLVFPLFRVHHGQ